MTEKETDGYTGGYFVLDLFLFFAPKDSRESK